MALAYKPESSLITIFLLDRLAANNELRPLKPHLLYNYGISIPIKRKVINIAFGNYTQGAGQ